MPGTGRKKPFSQAMPEPALEVRNSYTELSFDRQRPCRPILWYIKYI